MPGFFSGLHQNILANLAVIFLGALMLLVMWSNRFDLLGSFAEIAGYQLTPSQAEPAPSPPPALPPPKVT